MGSPHPSLAAVPGPVDLVYMFRGAGKGAKAVWMPEGVVHEAAAKARASGLAVVMDRCASKELSRAAGG